jgi:LuxR family maltose regulon positive regulatory protein
MRARLEKYRLLVFSWLHVVEGAPSETLHILDPLVSRLEDMPRTDLALEAHTLRALALQALGHVERALAALHRALSLAEPSGYVRTFVDKGAALARLLYRAAEQNIHPRYVGRLLASFQTADRAPAETTARTMVEPLSHREREVLELVADGLTNQQIAERLFLSLSTVKWHTHQIYGKLGVNRRTLAVAKARTLGILPALPSS